MRLHDCQTRVEKLDSLDAELVTWVPLNGRHIAIVRGDGIEVSVDGATRGEAIATLARELKGLTKELTKLGFEQEGALPITRGELR